MKLTLATAVFAVLLTGCAHRMKDRPIEPPGAAEIGTYVAAHWDAEFNQRFSRFAARGGQSSVFVTVQNARCELTWNGTVAECAYDVTTTFSDGKRVTRQLLSQFERGHDGALVEVLIIWHELKR